MDQDRLLQIGEVARGSGTPVDTIRYYEKTGLIDKPSRSEGGFRKYARESVEKLRFIRKAQSLGFSLREIKGIIQCSKEGLKPCCNLVRKLFTQKVSEFETKIQELEGMKHELESLLSDWVSPKEAKKKSYAVCPQIERGPKRRSAKRRGGFNSAK